ncbi:MAG: hypothetical protein WC750_04455 [Patescibacteria group bacterium]|jgi:CheY-like chemotaxis protein
MKILVVDDKQENLDSASTQLAEHELTIVSSYRAAEKLLDERNEFDVLLTDLMLLDGPGGVGSGEDEMGSGIWLALVAATRGVKWIGVLTDSTRHSGWEARAAVTAVGVKNLDGRIQPIPIRIQRSKMLVCTAETDGMLDMPGRTKNWARLLERLLLLNPVV